MLKLFYFNMETRLIIELAQRFPGVKKELSDTVKARKLA